jgi:Acyclic terpene utilisation family protein AtuA
MMGDRFEALEEAVQGEPVDAVIGDYVAEITMSMVAARGAEKAPHADQGLGLQDPERLAQGGGARRRTAP